MTFLQRVYWGNFVRDYLVAAGLAVAITVGTAVVRALVRRHLRRIARRSGTHLDDLAIAAVDQTRSWLILLVAVHVGALMLSLPDRATWLIGKAASTAVLFQLGIWSAGVVRFAVGRHDESRQERGRDPSGSTHILGIMARIVVWAGILLLTLDSFGINVSALVAGLGIGGIAVALAVQNILGDVFASLSITLDRPFELGDFIIVGDLLGNVEKIGIKTTRVRALSGELLIFSNNDLLGARIRNFQRMEERRAVFSIGVTYQTDPDQVEAIPSLLREAIEAQDKVRFDRAHFKTFAESALEFEAVYYLLDPEYLFYMDTQERINQSIYRAFRERDIDFAYPTRTLWMEGQATAKAA